LCSLTAEKAFFSLSLFVPPSLSLIFFGAVRPGFVTFVALWFVAFFCGLGDLCGLA
jgi:hypothetical protein